MLMVTRTRLFIWAIAAIGPSTNGAGRPRLPIVPVRGRAMPRSFHHKGSTGTMGEPHPQDNFPVRFAAYLGLAVGSRKSILAKQARRSRSPVHGVRTILWRAVTIRWCCPGDTEASQIGLAAGIFRANNLGKGVIRRRGTLGNCENGRSRTRFALPGMESSKRPLKRTQERTEGCEVSCEVAAQGLRPSMLNA